MEALETLRKSRELISRPENWSNSHLAADANGKEIIYTDSKAYAFCAIGAVNRIAYISDLDTLDLVGPALRALVNAIDSIDRVCELPDWNDSAAHADVLAGFDAAIAASSEEINATAS